MSPGQSPADRGVFSVRSANARVGLRALVLFAIVTSACAGGLLHAQDKQKPLLPPKKDITLQTSDGVVLKATYWASTLGKEATPVILAHGYRGSRQDFRALAEDLQKRGYAVIAPDLRGHGDSTKTEDPNRPLQAANMSPPQFLGLVDDLETVKKFLMAENNAGALNIDKLAIVAADMSAAAAMNWARLDWSWAPLAIGKQGQDVKALVLLSPPERFKSLRMSDAINDPAVRRELSLYIIVGDRNAVVTREAHKIFTAVKRGHPTPAKGAESDLFYREVPTSLQGSKLLAKEFGLTERIAEFLDKRAAKLPLIWKDRSLK